MRVLTGTEGPPEIRTASDNGRPTEDQHRER